MKKFNFLAAFVTILISVAIILTLTQCGRKRETHKLPEPPPIEFSRYISGFTGGIVPTDEPVRIQFAFEMIDSASIGKELPANLFSIRPAVKGTAQWSDLRTIEFRPLEKLPHDKVFKATFQLGNLINVDSKLKTFEFGFVTMPQAVDVVIENVEVFYQNQQPRVRLKGVAETADAADSKKLRRILNLQKGFGSGYEITWTHSGRNRRHEFTIDNITRENNGQELVIAWDGREIEASAKGSQTITLPPVGKLQLVNTHLVQLPEPRISLQFSEPIQQQNLNGLIYFADRKNLSTRISGNEITVFTTLDHSGQQVLTIEGSIADANGKRLGERVVREFVFQDLKPAVRLVGRGMILPASGDLLFPFEAVNLAAVDVEIVRILEQNVIQFLQTNRLDGDDQLRRVGRLIAKRTMALNTGNSTNLNKWNRFAIDLSEVINPEPGAIYRVYLAFRKEYSVYQCGETPVTMPTTVLNSPGRDWETVSDEVRYWGSYNEWEYYYDYDWQQRDNPCHESYYANKTVSRNILASNLGLLAKRDDDGTFHFAVTSLLNTNQVQGATITLYNFQQQLLETITTDRDGFATIKPRGIPFIAIAAKDNQKAYLRVDDGSSLSLSMFDVDGAKVQKGVKGFIYGERGVWRPGDTLFLNFVLDDRLRTLPSGFPLVFRLFNPLGQLVNSQVSTQGVNGFYPFRTLTQPDAPTGNYSAVVKLGGIEFSRTIRIETVMPNRLRINTMFAGDVMFGFAPTSGSLKAQWLHGGTARNLRAEVTATLNPAKTVFTTWRDYVFDDPSRKFQSETFPVFQGRIDANGQATLRADINLKSRAPGMLTVAIETKVFEEGGSFSIDRHTLPFHSYKTYAGLKVPRGSGWGGMLLTDSLHTIELANVDREGNSVSGGKLRVDVYKVSWRWWWDASDEYLGDFSAGSWHQPVKTQVVNTANGRANFNFRIDYPEWGRYLILVTDLESGHRAGEMIRLDWPAWYGSDREGRQQAAAMLTFTTDKEKYKPGDDLVISFPSSSGGRAMVSIENGSGVILRRWVETRDGNTSFKIKVTPEMAPNAYTHLTLLQPHAQTINDLPIRLYGIMPFLVEDPETRLEPVITMPDVLKPQQDVSITIKEQRGKAMTYTLAMVDEGLLDLTRFKTPDPWGHFYAREALGVKTWDMYDYVMGAFGSEFSRLLGIGGDDFIQPPSEAERANRFRPVVRFFGPFSLDRNKSRTHTFTMPQYVGSVRVMVVAGNQSAYGNAQKTVAVKQSLMALGTLPRVLGPGEKVSLPVNVFVTDASIKQVQVNIQTNDLLTVAGERSKTINFTAPGDQLLWFDLQTAGREGVAKVTATVKGGSETVSFDIELQVRNANTRLTSGESLVLDGNREGELSFDFTGMTGNNQASIEFSSIPPINLDKRLKFLTTYPHGCTEQLISGAFPQLFLDVFTELSDQEKQRIQTNIESVVGRLPSRQLGNGGISTWPGSTMANDWITSYTGHFVIEAQKKGYSPPAGFMDNWLRFQRDMANRWVADVESFGGDQVQAYRLFTMALSGNPDLGSMNRLRQRAQLTAQAQWHLAAAYALSGQTEAALKLAVEAPVEIPPYRIFYYTFGDHLRDKAVIVMVLNLLKQREKAALLVQQIAQELGSSQWISTHSTAFALMALSDFYRGNTRDSEIQARFALDGGREINVNSRALVVNQALQVQDDARTRRVKISNKSGNTLFVRVIHSGIPEAGREEAGNENLTMQVRFINLAGAPVDVRSLTQGTSVVADVTVFNPGARGNYQELALTRVFPSGWEISNARMDAAAAALQQDTPTYEDVRDDRVLTYFDLRAGETKTFKVLITATYQGRFYLPAFNIEAMYDASVYARNKGMWVEVKR